MPEINQELPRQPAVALEVLVADCGTVARGVVRKRGIARGAGRGLLLAAGVLVVAVFSSLSAARGAGAVAAKNRSVSWVTYGFNVARTGYNPSETVIGASSATRLHKEWSTDLGGAMIAQPVVAAGVRVHGTRMNVVYEGTEHGGFYAIREGDGHVLWHRNFGSITTPCNFFPNHLFGIGGAGTISFTSPGRGVVYVAGGDGAVHALDLATGSEQRGWPVRHVYNPKQLQVFGGLTLFRGELYVTTASLCDYPPYHGGAIEVSVSRHRVVSRFYPAGPPSGGISGGGIWGPGGVSIDAANDGVYTATGNALTEPENYRYSEAVVRLTRSLRVLGSSAPPLAGKDADFGATPILFKPDGCPHRLLAVEQKAGALFTYTTGNIRGGPRQRLQMADINHGSFAGIPAWDPATNILYVSNSSSSSSEDYEHGMVALKPGADCDLALAWQRRRGPTGANLNVSPPSVADGVVYYGDGRGNTEFAFNARTGKQLWSWKFSEGVYAAPTIVNGLLLVATWDNHLYAFGPAAK